MSETNVKTVDLVKAFNTEKRFLTLGGFYPISNNSKLTKCFYYIRGSFILTISGLEWLLLLICFYTQVPDLIKISESLLIFLTCIAFLCKLINFIMQKNRMIVIEKQLQNSLLTDIDEYEEKILIGYIKGVKLLAVLFRLLCVGAIVFYGVYPILDQGSSETRKLPLPIWVPFNYEDYYFYISFATLFTLSLGAWTNSNIDLLTIMLIIIATAQIEILKKRIRRVVPLNQEMPTKTVEERLIRCVVHFNEINRFIITVEKTFSNGIFIQFLCSVLVICLTGFQMLVISLKSIQFVFLITYFNCMMCQIIMYCWYGHLLMDSSDKITEACYCTDWYLCNAKIQKIFITIMERSKYPVKLRAANFFTLNLQTLMAILRSSYSYFALLQHIYSNRMH